VTISDGKPDAGTHERFSSQIERWLGDDTPKTLRELEKVFDERSFAVAVMLLMFPSALPIPTGGITHVLEIITLLLGVQLVAGRETIWLPERWRSRELGPYVTKKAIPFVVRRVRWFERWSRPRLSALFDAKWFNRLLGVVIIIFTIGALVAPPFSGLDTLPSMGAVAVALAILLRDIVVLAVGLVVGFGGVMLIVFLGSAALHLTRSLG
jgi:hypothetical protein